MCLILIVIRWLLVIIRFFIINFCIFLAKLFLNKLLIVSLKDGFIVFFIVILIRRTSLIFIILIIILIVTGVWLPVREEFLLEKEDPWVLEHFD